jgi:hypothetical protein
MALKLAIIKTGRHQWEIAREAGIHEARLSKFIHGYGNLSEGEKHRLKPCLGFRWNRRPPSMEGTSDRSS